VKKDYKVIYKFQTEDDHKVDYGEVNYKMEVDIKMADDKKVVDDNDDHEVKDDHKVEEDNKWWYL